MAADPTYPLYPVIAFIGFVLALIPLPWHLQSWNSGTCYYMVWTALACLNEFVNAVVWSNTVIDLAPVWCDISTRITIGASVGIPAASLCINRRLYKISRMQAVSTTRAEKRRAILIDTLICVLLPIICIALSYVVQGHRYNLFEILGCYPAIYNTVPAYPLVYMWPVAIGLVSAVYCLFSLRSLLARHAQFREFISSNTGITSSRYFRLMALAMTELLFTVPFGIYQIYSNSVGGVAPWQGWANAHYDFSRVDQYPAILWTSTPSLAVPLQLSRWIIPGCAFIFFAFFGFAEEARKRYYAVYCAAGSRLHALRILSFTSSYTKSVSTGSKASLETEEALPAYSPPAWSPGGRSLASVTVADSDSSPIKTSFSDKFSSETRYMHDQC